jgi:CheY-like chemotaxis protein
MILKSWKEIADYLHCGVRTAQRWERELGLPIRRPGDRSVVLATTEELSEWVASGKATAAVDTSARDMITRQAELRRELYQLRARQRQLMQQLRTTLKNTKPTRSRHAEISGSRTSLFPFPNSTRPSLMTVDDNPSQCYALSQVLRHAGFEVFEAHSAQQGLELAQRECPAIVLLDIHLPDLTGYELFSMLRRNPQTQNIAVIFYTAVAPSDAANFVVQQLGAEGFIESPIEPEVLIASVRNTMAKLNLTNDGVGSRLNVQPN